MKRTIPRLLTAVGFAGLGLLAACTADIGDGEESDLQTVGTDPGSKPEPGTDPGGDGSFDCEEILEQGCEDATGAKLDACEDSIEVEYDRCVIAQACDGARQVAVDACGAKDSPGFDACLAAAETDYDACVGAGSGPGPN
jgi:hypothetical protein